MKKTKGEAAANKNPKPAQKEEKISANDPTEKIRSKDGEGNGLSFKKILYGYDPSEVESYIEELSKTYEAAARNYEMKLSSIKEELVLSNRERDSYSEKYRECMASLEKPSKINAEEKSVGEGLAAEYKKIIDALNDRLERAELENEYLREQSSNSSAVPDEYSEKIAFLENENREISVKAESVMRRNEELLEIEQKYEALFNEYNSVTAQLEYMRAEKASAEKQMAELKTELEEKAEDIRSFSLANDELKRKQTELEAENTVLSRCAEENEAEIARLKEINKTQAHDYADKINLLESEQANSRLAVQKEIKLRDYYIGQAQATLSELSEQMEIIRKTFTPLEKE